jgi:putative ABC transport system permease protein
MIIKLIVRNLLFKPLNTLLSIVLLTTGTAIVLAMLTIQQQTEKKFLADLQDIDMVIGAKGSPLQLVLSSVYQIDAPTGNIAIKEVEKITNNPLVESITPLAYGDNYKGYKLVGTDSTYWQRYKAICSKGRFIKNDFEVVIGSNAASKLQLAIGSSFFSTHGLAEKGEAHDNEAYKVVGILQPTQTVVDNLLISNIETVHHLHQHHDAADDDNEQHEETEQITAAFVKFRSPMGMLIFPRLVNESSNLMAAIPAIEINRLTNLLGIGFTTLQYIAFAIIAMAAISVFISLYTKLQNRIHEMALLRCYGYSKWSLLLLVFGESLLLCCIGFAVGYMVSLIGLHYVNNYSLQEMNTPFIFNYWSNSHSYIFVSIIGISALAAIVPAIKTYTLKIAHKLSHA